MTSLVGELTQMTDTTDITTETESEYVAPQLIVYGAMAELTAAGSGTMGETGAGMMGPMRQRL